MNLAQELVLDTQRRLPAGQHLVEEAFTSDHRHPVMVAISELCPDTFYVLDEITAHALADAVVDLAVHHGGGRLTVNYPFAGEFQAQQHRLQHLAQKLDSIRVLSVGRLHKPDALPSRVEFTPIDGTALTRFRIVLNQGAQSFAFISRESLPGRAAKATKSLGLFTFDEDTVDAFVTDIETVLRNRSSRLGSFERLQTLHQTTQQVAHELDSYARRLELAIQRAHRRPDLLTPQRFERIVRQAIVKMEQLQEIPRRALRTMGKSNR